MNNIYCVRQKSTGWFIPALKGQKRGGSYTEPEANCKPRLFQTKLAARSFISMWVKGIYKTEHSTDHNGYPDSYLIVKKQDHRNKDDMEIVEFMLTEMY